MPNDTICDPSCGTAGFLVAAGEDLSEQHPEILPDPELKKYFDSQMFTGFGFDSSMLSRLQKCRKDEKMRHCMK